MQKITYIHQQISSTEKQIKKVLELFNEDCTLPFIARYRKDDTGNLDEVEIKNIQDYSLEYDKLEARKKSILEKLHKLENIQKDILDKIAESFNLDEIEFLYEPYKGSKNKSFELAQKNGWEKYAKMLMSNSSIHPEELLNRLINYDFKTKEEVKVGIESLISNFIYQNSIQLAIQKAKNYGVWTTKKKTDAKEDLLKKYEAYLDFSKKVKHISSHQFLAIERAKEDAVLRIKLSWEDKEFLENLKSRYVKKQLPQTNWLEEITKTTFSKKIKPKVDREVWKIAKEQADIKATEVFSKNLEQLLLSPPLGSKRILGIDPGYRTGCKMVCIDKNGDLQFNETIYPFSDDINKKKFAGKKLRHAIEVFKIEAIAVGNGTAGKETYDFVKKQSAFSKIPLFLVDESGASVYSASSIARKEFPTYDITVRGAVSIARRLMDPLAELIKIDPKSIGIGQYQHSVNQKLLEKELDFCIEKSVNKVGVNVNTASEYLLQHISGLNQKLAQKIVEKRSELGKFTNREQIKSIKGIGQKTYEQSIAFLKIFGGDNYVDGTFIHPEHYPFLEKLYKNLDRESLLEISNLSFTDVEKFGIGEHSFKDIQNAILKPNLNIRKRLGTATIDNNLKDINDLSIGKKVQGQVKNITNFGCFIDLGIKQNALLHVSKMAKRFVSDVHEIVQLNQLLEVTVISLDLENKKIGVSIIEESE